MKSAVVDTIFSLEVTKSMFKNAAWKTRWWKHENRDKAWTGGKAAAAERWEKKVQTDVGVMRSQRRKLSAVSKWMQGGFFFCLFKKNYYYLNLILVADRISKWKYRWHGGRCESNCKYCMSFYDTGGNWIIKTHLTKACALPPAERRCQRSVTSSIYVHWSLWWGRSFLLKALHHQLLLYIFIFPAGSRTVVLFKCSLFHCSIHFTFFLLYKCVSVIYCRQTFNIFSKYYMDMRVFQCKVNHNSLWGKQCSYLQCSKW